MQKKGNEKTFIHFVTKVTPELVDRVAEHVYRQLQYEMRLERERLARLKR